MSGIISSRIQLLRRVFPVVARRFVSTTKKNNDTVTAEVAKKTIKVDTKEQNWMSYGYDFTSKSGDRNAMHSIMFVTITLCLTVGGYYLAYMPDYTLRDWAQREAFLELRRREESGRPRVDPNFIDPGKFNLPSDEELKDVEIII